MKVTVQKDEEIVLKAGDIIKSKSRGTFYMVGMEIDDKLVLINLTTFRKFSEKYESPAELLKHFFTNGHIIYPAEKNELVIGGSK